MTRRGKLNGAEIDEIIELLETTALPYRVIGEQYGVAISTISDICAKFQIVRDKSQNGKTTIEFKKNVKRCVCGAKLKIKDDYGLVFWYCDAPNCYRWHEATPAELREMAVA